MYGGPQQFAFENVMTQLGLSKGDDLSGGSPNIVSFAPNVRSCTSRQFQPDVVMLTHNFVI